MPDSARYSSALRAMLRGSRLYASRVTGSCTKKLMLRVFSALNGSSRAVARSGSSSMSDSWISWKPRTDEPSNARPSSIVSWPKDCTGTVKCCMMPGRSQNRTSTNFTSSSEMKPRTSSEVLNTLVTPSMCAAVRDEAMRTVLPGHHPDVSRVLTTVLRPCRVVQKHASSARSGHSKAYPDPVNAETRTPQKWPGERLGLPERGPGSVASMGTRLVALLIDGVLASLIAYAFTAPAAPLNWSLVPWFVITVLTVSFFGCTPGMWLLGIRVARTDGASMVGPIRAVGTIVVRFR